MKEQSPNLSGHTLHSLAGHFLTFTCAFFLSKAESVGQIKTNTRTINGAGQFGGVSIVAPQPSPHKKKTTKITYLAVTDNKEWVNTEGKTIKGRLIAFDPGDKKKFIPPTIIKENNVRILIGSKAYVFPLEKLKEDNRNEILNLMNGFKAHYERVKKAQEKGDSQ